MVSQLGRHGGFDLEVTARGDLEVDAHHTVEDVGITIGEVLAAALGDKAGIRRFGSVAVPLDEALVEVALDLSGRPFLTYDIEFAPDTIALGTPPFDPQLAEEFWRAFATSAGMTLHVRLRTGQEHPPHRGGVVQGGGPGPARRGAGRGRRHPLHQGDLVMAPAPDPRPGARRRPGPAPDR